MKLETTEPEEIKLEMTSMIDIVFQLLIFFIMTFKVVALEGDFNIKMPLASTKNDSLDIELPELMVVKLNADENGELGGITADGKAIGGGLVDAPSRKSALKGLTEYCKEQTGGEVDPENPVDIEVEFDIDPRLHYGYTVNGIESVSGFIKPDRTIGKLLSRIKFKDNSKGF